MFRKESLQPTYNNSENIFLCEMLAKFMKNSEILHPLVGICSLSSSLPSLLQYRDPLTLVRTTKYFLHQDCGTL